MLGIANVSCTCSPQHNFVTLSKFNLKVSKFDATESGLVDSDAAGSQPKILITLF